MKLMSLLNVIDDQESILVWDDNKPIDVPPLFKGKVKDCKCHRSFGNGIVEMIIPEHDHLAIFINIEYQKSKAQAKIKGGAE